MDEDLLRGASEIGEFIGRSAWSAYKLSETRKIPTFKIGGCLYARKSKLRELFVALEQQASDAAE